ncbi:MAG: cell envelope integrity protein TolA [Holosporales bacterium]|jgi:outer membrane biosynthesis protein TonB|nr:cell envelope integrity protein TolA [Holosporales bacterium]
MNKKPLLVSFILHVVVVLLLYADVGRIFSSKIKDSGYAVFDFVELGDKSKAPVLSNQEGKLSKTKSNASDEAPDTSMQSPANLPESKEEVTNRSDTDDGETPKVVVKEKRKKQTQKPPKTKKHKKEDWKSSSKSQTKEKAVVNLKRDKRKNKVDPKAAKKSFSSILDDAAATDDNENSGIKAEEVGDVLTATQIDLIRQTIRKCWHFPAGLKSAEDLVVDIKMELDQSGNVTKAEIVDTDRMNSDPDFKIAAENAHRAVLECSPLPLPKEKYNEWKNLELSFNPKDMLN